MNVNNKKIVTFFGKIIKTTFIVHPRGFKIFNFYLIFVGLKLKSTFTDHCYDLKYYCRVYVAKYRIPSTQPNYKNSVFQC